MLGTALGYNLDQLQNFICSFREFNSVDDIILFVDLEITSNLKSFFAQYNVQTLNLKNQEFSDTLIHNRRFIEYLDFLSLTDYNQVLLADIRDVIFQSDPFTNSNDKFLNLFLEDSGSLIGPCRYNSFWVEAAYGDLGKEKLFPLPIICCGTILGSQFEILKYLKKYKEELLKIKSQRPDVYAGITVDQAIANYIGHVDNQNLNLEIRSNGDIVGTIGLSMTVGSAKDQIVFKNGSILVNHNKPSIVHQYDRHQKLSDFYSLKYSQGINLNSLVI